MGPCAGAAQRPHVKPVDRPHVKPFDRPREAYQTRCLSRGELHLGAMEQEERRIYLVCIGEGAHLHVHLVQGENVKRCNGEGDGRRGCKGVCSRGT
jgi:hypothetical protein